MNSKKIIPFFLIFCLFLLQNAIALLFPQKTPTLLLIAVLFYALSEGPLFGALLGAFAGALLEIFGQGRMGSDTVVLAAAGFIFGHSARTFFRESLLAQFFFPVLAFYFVALSRLVLYQISSGGGFDLSFIRAVLLPWDVAVVFASAPVIFFCLRKVSYSSEGRR